MAAYVKRTGTQVERPKEVDTASSPTTVYLRRNIKRVQQREPQSGETVNIWEYEEMKISVAEYASMLEELGKPEKIKEQETYAVIMEAQAETFEKLMSLEESLYTIMEAIAEIDEKQAESAL